MVHLFRVEFTEPAHIPAVGQAEAAAGEEVQAGVVVEADLAAEADLLEAVVRVEAGKYC